jgi:uncharacterized protein YndB with AHSA1/START domain
MTRIRVATTIDAPPARVWDDVRDIASHVEWMHDAVAIRFTSRRRSGVGTTFVCDTRVGPLRLSDEMEVTEWRDRRAIGIRHVGLVTGAGRFTLRRRGGRRTRFAWEEQLRFPIWMGGPVGGAIGGLVLRAVWKRNLRTLKKRVERGPAG